MSKAAPLHSSRELTASLAKALGLPDNTVRAVLTLDATEPPRLEVTVLVVNTAGRHFFKDSDNEDVGRRIARVQFMVRLEPFPDTKDQP